MRGLFRRLVEQDDGQTMIEYALLAGIIAVAAITILSTLRGSIVDVFGTVNDALTGAQVGDAG
jgi:pilus assembly protein Flp/PilA